MTRLTRMRAVYGVARGTFGAWIAPPFTALMLFGLYGAVTVGLALDPLFFPKLRDGSLRAPLVIVGNPRTGSTFLHRFLVDNGVGAGSEVWRMLVPSLVLQRLVRPLLPLLKAVDPTRHHAVAAHKTSLTSVETDDVSFLFRYLDGFFLYGFFLAFDEEERRDWFDPVLRDTTGRDFTWLSTLWRRMAVGAGQDRMVGKLFSVSVRVPAFLEAFPDARLVYLVRDPCASIPSAMSLITGVLEARYGFWRLPEEVRSRYLERLYGGLVDLMLRFETDWTSGRIPRERVKIVRFDRLMSEFDVVMEELLTFADHEVDTDLRESVVQTAATQRAYRSEHQYVLATFGLAEARIRTDCAAVYDTFLS